MERYMLVVISALLHTCQADVTDYCLHETMNASCTAADEVIIMEKAAFGRMKAGRCISGEGYISCSADVLSHLDGHCSGRPACDFTVRNLIDLQPCRRDFMSYLEAAYTCVKVSFAQTRYCPDDQRGGVLGDSVGYLAAGVGGVVGSPECPWIIHVLPGLRLNLTLFDFTISTRRRHVTSADQSRGGCRMVITVEENSGRHDFNVCQTNSRTRHIYQSQANHIRVYVRHTDSWTDNRASYLIRYEALGCATPAVPARGWLKRTSDTAIISCNDTSETWHLICKGNEWLGRGGNCTKGHHSSEHLAKDAESRLQYGIFIAILIGIVLGVLTGSLLLIVVHFLRHKRSPAPRDKVCRHEAVSMATLPRDNLPANGIYATRHELYPSAQQMLQLQQGDTSDTNYPSLHFPPYTDTFPVLISDTYGHVTQSNYVCHHCGVICPSKPVSHNAVTSSVSDVSQQTTQPAVVTDKMTVYECPYHCTPMLQ